MAADGRRGIPCRKCAMTKRPAGRQRPQFEFASLREAASGKVFIRRTACLKGGQVEIVKIDKASVLANVINSKIHHSELQES